MDISNVVLFLKKHGQFYCQEKHFCKKFPKYYDDIIGIKFPDGFTFQQKLYHYFNNDLDFKLGICKICKKNRCKFISFGLGYKSHCSRKCLGVDEEVKLQRKNTIKLSEDFYEKRYKKSKETSLKRYGVENYSSTKECRDRVNRTFKKRYGVENYSQTNEFAKYHRKQIEYDGLTFDSSWEVKVYQYCKENNISCEYQPNIQFEYEYDGKKHIYQPDFLINGKLYEVKGNHFFDGDKMICPFDRNQDELYESKHQCMIKNNIIVLTKYDIKKIKEMF